MCRNIKTLFNFDPPATTDEVQASALQFVRKLSGMNKPSKANEETFYLALERVALDQAIAEHHAILEAIRDGDADRAGDVMRAHVVSFERAIRAVL